MEWMSGSADVSPTFNMTDDDLTCAARTIQESYAPLPTPHSRALLLAVKIILVLVYYSTFTSGSFLNIFLFYLIIRYKKLHTLTFGISLQIVVLDLLQLFCVNLFDLVTVFSEEWILGAEMCIFIGFISHTVRVARSLFMCVFVIDRFLSIFAAFCYPRYSKKITITHSVVAWVVALLFQVPILPGLFDCYSFSALQRHCAASSTCNPSCLIFGRLFLFLIYVPTTLVPVVLYALLYWKVKKIKRQVRAVVPVHALQEDQSASRVFRSKQNWKAAITFFTLFLATFILTSPANVGIIIIMAVFRSYLSSPAMYICVLLLSSVSSLLVIADPIVIMRHRDVKEVLHEIKTKLCGRCGLCRDQNRPVRSLPASSDNEGQNVHQEQD